MAQWEKLNAYKPDDIDLEALSQFRSAIEQNILTDKKFALEKAIEKFSLSKEKVSIGRYCLTDFPMERPKNVTSKSGRHFQAYPIMTHQLRMIAQNFLGLMWIKTVSGICWSEHTAVMPFSKPHWNEPDGPLVM